MPEQNPREGSVITGDVIKDRRSDDEAAYNDVLAGLPRPIIQDAIVENGNQPHSSTRPETTAGTNVITTHRQSGLSLTDTASWRTLTALRARAKTKKPA